MLAATYSWTQAYGGALMTQKLMTQKENGGQRGRREIKSRARVQNHETIVHVKLSFLHVP